MREATPDQRRLHWILIGLYVAFALMFAWVGATSRWEFFIGSAAGAVAAVAELRTRGPYPAHETNVHVVPSSWWTRRIPALLGLPVMFVAFGIDFITRGNLADGLGTVAVTLVFIGVMVWTQRDIADRVEVTEDGIVLRLLLGVRPARVVWPDLMSVTDRGDGVLVRVRTGKGYFLSQELSDFGALTEKLKTEELKTEEPGP